MDLPIVKDVCDRKKLSEGRNFNMGFAFCKQLSNGTFETVQPISPCKDYLNDVVYTEHTGKPFQACGLSTVKHGIFENAPHAFLAIKMLPPKGSVYTDLEASKKRLQQNYKHIETLLNFVEEQFSKYGIDDRTAITPTQDPDLFLLAVPLWWCRTTHLISLYSLLVRMGQFWDGTVNPATFLENYNNPLDLSLWIPGYGAGAYIRYQCMLKYGIRLTSPQEQFDLANGSIPHVHGCGILAY